MERALVTADQALPTIFRPLGKASLGWVSSMFELGCELEMPPVGLVRTDQGLLTIDGHHRLTTSRKYERPIRAEIFSPGERCELHYLFSVTLDEFHMDVLERLRQRAIDQGFVTFEDVFDYTFSSDRWVAV